jgi:hypothetical protein
MLSAAECLAKAAELSQRAEGAHDPALRRRLLAKAETWLDVARTAEWQDACFYLIQRAFK